MSSSQCRALVPVTTSAPAKTGTALVPVETVEIKPLALTKWSHQADWRIF